MNLFQELADSLMSILRILYRIVLEWWSFKPDAPTSSFLYDIHSAYPHSQACGKYPPPESYGGFIRICARCNHSAVVYSMDTNCDTCKQPFAAFTYKP